MTSSPATTTLPASPELTDEQFVTIGEEWIKAQRMSRAHLAAFMAGVRACSGTHRSSPSAEWRCFHCGEVFTSKVDAALHFGSERAMSTPSCRIKQEGEFALLTALRNAEDRIEGLIQRQDDTDIMRAMWSMQADRARALREEEEKGYARGLRDGRDPTKQEPLPEPPK